MVIFEQHYVAGGCTHCFTVRMPVVSLWQVGQRATCMYGPCQDQGFEFDTGVHYIGQATQRITQFSDDTLMDLL